MASIRGKFFVWAVRNFFSISPTKTKNQIATLKKLNNIGTFRCPKNIVYEKIVYDGLPLEVFYKKGSTPKNVIYFLHGGAYIGALGNNYRNKAQSLIEYGHDAKVVFIDYRVAPEHVYPCALEDAKKGWDWLLSQGYKEENIVTIGDSAGGNLNLTLNLYLRDHGKKLPKAMVLISPWADMLASGDSYIYNLNKDPMFGDRKLKATKELLASFYDMDIYTWCKQTDRKSPYVSPILADYYGFPTTFITAGGYEMLLSDSLTIKDNMLKNGVDCTIRIDDGMFHIYPLFTPLFPEAKHAFNDILKFISKQLNK